MEGLRHILTNRRALLWWLATAAAWLGVAWLTDTAGLVVDGVPLIVAAAGVAFTAVQLGGPWLATALFAAASARASAWVCPSARRCCSACPPPPRVSCRRL